MLLTISPAKTLDFSSAPERASITYPAFINEAEYLVNKLKKFSPRKLKSMMDISNNLADLNYERFQEWTIQFNKNNSKEAIYVFKGDVYQGLNVESLQNDALTFLQNNLLILSGLYGTLKPFDSMMAYRLEMGSSFKVTPSKSNLYKFWGNKITEEFNKQLELQNTDTLINLASNEYFKAVNTKKLKADIIVPEFKDMNKGSYKMISFFAKKARGMMLRYIAENNITEPEHIKSFDSDGYYFNNSLSKDNKWVFTRDH
jgi:cytoplasmic iron level regulating protein YaaA (DUF328/UPF0246 family)